MSRKLFAKPPPAQPKLESAWLRRTDRSDGKREPFFFGRDREYEIFRSAATSLQEGEIGGGTVIFQGAPGAGKTALMQGCMEAVRRHSSHSDPWVCIPLMPETLMSAAQVMEIILDAVNKESQRLLQTAPETASGMIRECLKLGQSLYAALSERGVAIGGFSAGGKPRSNLDTRLLAQPAFTQAAPLLKRFNLVVFVDEAQSMPVEESTKGVMSCLHNPPENIPLIAAFFWEL